MKLLGKIIGIGLLICLLANCRPDIKSNSGYCYLKDSSISDFNGFKKDYNSFFIPTYLYKDSTKIEAGLNSFDYIFNSLLYSYFNEPLLYNYYLGENRYRLLEAPSLFPYPYLITIYKQDNKYFIQGKFLKHHKKHFMKIFEKIFYIDSLGNVHGNDKDAINKIKYVYDYKIKDSTKRISIKEWNYFTKLLDSVNFWNTRPNNFHRPVIDGSDWVLEGHEENRYWFVIDNCNEACEYLKKISPFANDIYGIPRR